MLELQNISLTYSTDTIRTHALREICLRVAKGEFMAVMGPSGGGKSTLLNVLGLLEMPTSGSYVFNSIVTTALSESGQSELRKKQIGFIFQSFNLIDELDVFENVALPLTYQKVAKADRIKLTKIAINTVGLSHREHHFPSQLSGGQKQRVAIARAVVASPQLVLADEPTGNLDSDQGREVMELLQSLNSNGSTIVMVTHSEQHASFASRIVRIHDGLLTGEK